MAKFIFKRKVFSHLLPHCPPSSGDKWNGMRQYSHDKQKRYQNHRLPQSYAKFYKIDIQTQNLLPSSTPSSPVLGGRVKGNEAIQPLFWEKESNHRIVQKWYSNAKSSPIFYPIVPRPRGTSETEWGNPATINRKGVKIIEYRKIRQNSTKLIFKHKIFSHLLPHRPPSSVEEWNVMRQYSHYFEKRNQNHRISQNYGKWYKLDIQTQSFLPSSTPSSPVLGGRVKCNEAMQPR